MLNKVFSGASRRPKLCSWQFEQASQTIQAWATEIKPDCWQIAQISSTKRHWPLPAAASIKADPGLFSLSQVFEKLRNFETETKEKGYSLSMRQPVHNAHYSRRQRTRDEYDNSLKAG
jgi:hypothetical protein